MQILALDTSTAWLSVAVHDGHSTTVLRERAGSASSEHVLPLVERVLADGTTRGQAVVVYSVIGGYLAPSFARIAEICRRAKVPVIVDALAALGIARLGADGFEADDVIGTLATRWGGTMEVDIVTGDRDLLQLVDDARGVRVLYTGKGGVRDPDLATQDYLRERYAVDTGDAYLDMSVLRGDTSDGLPGVKGIGDKTAAQLIATYGSLAGLREAVHSGDPAIRGVRRANLEAASAYLDVAPTVVRVARDAPVDDVDPVLPTQVADVRLLSELASTYGVTNPLNRVLSALGLG